MIELLLYGLVHEDEFTKRAGLSAAYDYYPFGMQMPGRVVEDASVQCIPVTKYRQVDKIVSNEDVMQTYDPGDQSSPKFAGSGSNTHVAYTTQTGGGYKATLTSVNNNNLVLDASMTFRVLPSATTGLIVDVTVSENNFPDVTGVSRNSIGQGTLEVELRNLASGGIGTYLTTVFITGGGTGRMTVLPGMVAPGNVIRMWMHYVGPPPPWQLFVPNKRAQIIYTSVVSNIIKPADEQYVVLSCDTDGVYTPGYRYGFNGQEKDDEIAGKGNHNTALFWEYDPRLGRRWNLDPIDQVRVSNYAVNKNSPIGKSDPNGDCTDCKGKGPGYRYSESKEKPGSAELEDVVVKSSRKLSASYESAINNSSAPNFTGPPTVRSNNVNFLLSFGGEKESIYNEFRTGTGPENSIFLDDNPLTQRVRDWNDVGVLRDGAYEKFTRIEAEGGNIADNPYTNVRVGFNPLTTASGAGQFVGSASGDVFPSPDGKTLIFVVSDAKGLHSLGYHVMQDHGRGPGTNRYGNTVQKYIWTEPYNPDAYRARKRHEAVDQILFTK